MGETTKDKKLHVDPKKNVIGACGTAPAMMLNNDYHENLNVQASLGSAAGRAGAQTTMSDTETLFIQHFNDEARPLAYYLKKMNWLCGGKESFSHDSEALMTKLKSPRR